MSKEEKVGLSFLYDVYYWEDNNEDIFTSKDCIRKILCSALSFFICESNRKASAQNMLYHVPNPDRIL